MANKLIVQMKWNLKIHLIQKKTENNNRCNNGKQITVL